MWTDQPDQPDNHRPARSQRGGLFWGWLAGNWDCTADEARDGFDLLPHDRQQELLLQYMISSRARRSGVDGPLTLQPDPSRRTRLAVRFPPLLPWPLLLLLGLLLAVGYWLFH